MDKIHFITTEQHPRDFNNSIYHGYIKGGKIFDSYGNVLDSNFFDEEGIGPAEPTRIYRGAKDNVAWTSDINLDENGYPYIAFSVQKNSAGLPPKKGGDDHRYHYARWNGIKWLEYEIAYAGTRLYAGEDDYTGNIALDPNDLRIVYISTDANPVTGRSLISKADNRRHYEIFRGETPDSGITWIWFPVTENSTMDNIRPIVPVWNRDSTILLWMRGSYTTYMNYNTDIATIITTPNGKACYWSRGNGWVFAALVRVLDELPESDAHRQEYIETFKKMASALKSVQREDGTGGYVVSLKLPLIKEELNLTAIITLCIIETF